MEGVAIIFFIFNAVVGFVWVAFAVGTGVYFGNKWTKNGLPGILQNLESNKDKKEK